MMDTQLLQAFEAGEMPPGGFGHREHVRLAWLYLQDADLMTALGRFTAGLRNFATRRGHPGLYHETITWAYFLMIHERMARGGVGTDFEDFAAANPDLLIWKGGALQRYYRPETLQSDLARRVFVFPDRAPVG